MAILTIWDRAGLCRCSRRLRGLTWALSVWLLAAASAVPAPPPAPHDYQVKAVLLYNFAQFVEWPPEVFRETQSPMVIGVLGEDPFGAFLDDTVRGEKVNNRPLVVQRYRRVEDIKTCHILFISQSESDRLEQVFAGLKGRNILTVGDFEGFALRRGMIRFLLNENNKIRLRINVEAAKEAGLTISSKLLRAAELVNTKEPGS